MPDHELDYLVTFTCGCSVVFDIASGYRTSRMDACEKHGGRDQFEDRNEIVRMARERKDADIANRGACN